MPALQGSCSNWTGDVCATVTAFLLLIIWCYSEVNLPYNSFLEHKLTLRFHIRRLSLLHKPL